MIFQDLGNTVFCAVFLSIKEINKKLKNDEQQYDALCQENEYLREKLRDREDRSRRNNLRIDGLQEAESEKWEETEKIN